MMDADIVKKQLRGIQNAQSHAGRQVACTVVRQFLQDKHVTSKSRLVEMLLCEKWADLAVFFKRVEQNQDVGSFLGTESRHFNEYARNVMALNDFTSNSLDDVRPPSRMVFAERAFSPEPHHPLDVVPRVITGLIGVLLLACIGYTLFWPAGGVQVKPVVETPPQPTCEARLEEIESWRQAQIAQNEDILSRLRLEESWRQTQIAQNEDILSRLRMEESGSAAAQVVHDEILRAALSNALDEFKSKSDLTLLDSGKGVDRLMTRITEGRNELAKIQKGLKETGEMVSKHSAKFDRVFKEIKPLTERLDGLQSKAEAAEQSVNTLTQKQHEASDHLRSYQRVYLCVVAVIVLVCAGTVYCINAGVSDMERLASDTKKSHLELLCNSHEFHERLRVNEEYVADLNDRVTMLENPVEPPEDLPAGPGKSRGRGRARA